MLLDISSLLLAPSEEALLGRVADSARSLVPGSRVRFDLRAPPPEGPAGTHVEHHLLRVPVCDVHGVAIGMLELARQERTFGPRDLRLAHLMAEQAALAIQRFRLERGAEPDGALRQEMQRAHEVKAAIMRATSPPVPGLEAHGWTRNGSITGGDCVDYWRLSDGRLALFLGDASGHGLAAGLVISQVRALLRALSDVRADPDWLLARVNARLYEDRDSSRFVTAFLGCLSADGWLEWSSAGQGPVFLRAASREPFEAQPARGLPLGVMPELDLDPPRPLRLGPGGRVAVVSDGVLDAANESGRLLGAAGVKTALDGTNTLPPERAVELVRDVLQTWEGRRSRQDDQSILIAGRPD